MSTNTHQPLEIVGNSTRSRREQEVLHAVIAILEKRLKPGRIVLFGSRAKGKSHPGSDFDLAADKDQPDLTLERQIREDIDEVSGLYSVDVVYLNSVDEAFTKVILKTGRTVYERRDSAGTQ